MLLLRRNSQLFIQRLNMLLNSFLHSCWALSGTQDWTSSWDVTFVFMSSPKPLFLYLKKKSKMFLFKTARTSELKTGSAPSGWAVWFIRHRCVMVGGTSAALGTNWLIGVVVQRDPRRDKKSRGKTKGACTKSRLRGCHGRVDLQCVLEPAHQSLTHFNHVINWCLRWTHV